MLCAILFFFAVIGPFAFAKKRYSAVVWSALKLYLYFRIRHGSERNQQCGSPGYSSLLAAGHL